MSGQVEENASKSNDGGQELVIYKNDGREEEITADKLHTYRECLPSPMLDRSKISIWSILKQCVDKEIYRFTIPILWNEPLSLLQRSAESMRYANELLEKAARLDSAVDRMKHIAAFVVSLSAIQTGRTSKPFNPLLGETFEFTSLRDKFRICCEQVSHHPPVSAFYSESLSPTADQKPSWTYHGSAYPHLKLNILSGCIEATPEGLLTVELPHHDEVYTWHAVKLFAHNLVIGKLWFEYCGHLEIVNHKLNMKCKIDFKPYSWFSRQLNRFEGHIVDANQNKLSLVYGKWDDCFYATSDVKSEPHFVKKVEKLIDTNEHASTNADLELVWKFDLKVDHTAGVFDRYFNFNAYTFALNEMHDELRESTAYTLKDSRTNVSRSITMGPIAPTDSRYRPDMRFYEEGKLEEASDKKHYLEEKQRDKQRETNESKADKWSPLWFVKKTHPFRNDEQEWTFLDTYWKRDFSNCPDIY